MTKAQIIATVETLEGAPRDPANRRWLMGRNKANLEMWLRAMQDNYRRYGPALEAPHA